MISKRFHPIAAITPLFLFFLCTLTPWISYIFFPRYMPYDAKRILELVMLIVVNLYFSLSNTYRTQGINIYAQFSKKYRYMLLMILGIGILSALLAPMKIWALLEVALYIQLLYLSLFIASHNVTWEGKSDQAITLLILISAIIYLFSFSLIRLFADTKAQLYIGMFPGFVNLRFFAQYQIWTLPCISLPIFLYSKNKFVVLSTYLISIFWFALSITNGAKGTLLGIIIGLSFATLLYRKRILHWLWVQLKILLGSIIVTYSLTHNGTSTLHKKIIHHHALWMEKIERIAMLHHTAYTKIWLHNDVIYRFKLTLIALTLSAKHLLLGVGPMNFAHYNKIIAAHPHNILLLIASEWGCLALLLIAILFILSLRKWWHIQKERTSPLAIALTVSLMSGLGYGLVSGILITPLSQIMLAIITGWMMGYYFRKTQYELVTHSDAATLGFISLSTISIIIIIVIVPPMLSSLPTKEIGWFLHHPIHTFSPRFWIQGWI